jgi:hypothetical protein
MIGVILKVEIMYNDIKKQPQRYFKKDEIIKMTKENRSLNFCKIQKSPMELNLNKINALIINNNK